MGESWNGKYHYAAKIVYMTYVKTVLFIKILKYESSLLQKILSVCISFSLYEFSMH